MKKKAVLTKALITNIIEIFWDDVMVKLDDNQYVILLFRLQLAPLVGVRPGTKRERKFFDIR